MMTIHASPSASARLALLMQLRPDTPDALHTFVRRVLGLNVGRVAVSAGSTPPFDYLCHTFFHGGDCVVWANRGGGKTMLGAVATLLDLVFLPGVQVRILGGSLEQSAKMYEHLRTLLDRPALRDATRQSDVLARPATSRRVELANGSRVEILAGSQRSVRGTRVHKLRCDEVEEFDPAVWEAAQLVTRSGELPATSGALPDTVPEIPGAGGRWVRGGVEGLSTMHRPFGLMSKLVGTSGEARGEDAAAQAKRGLRVFRWNAMDVAATCPPALDCDGCPLWDDCGGRAKHATGFVHIEDLLDQRRRTSDRTWAAEMMCQRPSVESSVYPNFNLAQHVTAAPGSGTSGRFESSLGHVTETPGGETGVAAQPPRPRGASTAPNWVGGMDFGLRSPHVMLWAQVTPAPGTPGTPGTAPGTSEMKRHGHFSARASTPGGGGTSGGGGAFARSAEAHVHVIDEYVVEGLTLDRHLQAIDQQRQRHGWPDASRLAWVGVDPAGHQRNAHSGRTDIALLRDAGYRVRSARSRIAEGIEIVRRRLDRGTLTIHPRCAQLIDALRAYRFAPGTALHPYPEEPVKDGPDHACDALRYLLLNLERAPRPPRSTNYLLTPPPAPPV